MKYRRLGRTGLRISVVGVGAWQLSGEWGQRFTQPEVDRLLGRARELGINLVDTAECYGDHEAEALIGQAIHRQRHDWVIATKFGHRFHPDAMARDRWSPVAVRSDHRTPKEVIAQLEASLQALSTDRIDLYQMHSGPDEAFDQDDLWEVLNQQVAKGTVWHLGVSLGSNDNVYQAMRAGHVATAAWRAACQEAGGIGDSLTRHKKLAAVATHRLPGGSARPGAGLAEPRSVLASGSGRTR